MTQALDDPTSKLSPLPSPLNDHVVGPRLAPTLAKPKSTYKGPEAYTTDLSDPLSVGKDWQTIGKEHINPLKFQEPTVSSTTVGVAEPQFLGMPSINARRVFFWYDKKKDATWVQFKDVQFPFQTSRRPAKPDDIKAHPVEYSEYLERQKDR